MAYLNPANSGVSLPQMPLGPLTGFLSGMQIDTANRMNDRIMRDDDLEYLINQIKQQQDASNLQVNQAKNQNELLNQQILANQFNSGMKQRQANAAVLADTSKNQAEGVSAQDSINQSLAVPTVQMADFIKQNGGRLDPTNPAHLEAWQNYAKVLQYHGVKPPAFPDPQQQAALMQKGAAYVNSAPYQQQIGAINAKGAIEKSVADIGAESRERAAATTASGHVQGAQITANANVQRTQMQMEMQRNQQQSLIATMALIRRKGGYTPEDVAFVRQQATLMFLNGPDYEIARTIASTNPTDPVARAKLQAVQEQARQQAESFLNQDPSFVAAAKKLDGGASTTQSTESGSNSIENAVKATGSTYEPDKYDYRIDPATGKVQRKAKQ